MAVVDQVRGGALDALDALIATQEAALIGRTRRSHELHVEAGEHLPGGAEASAAIMAPVEAHLADHPGDFVGAQAILLSAVIGAPVTVDDPSFAAARANAEPFIRDEPDITSAALDEAAVRGADVTIGVGSAPNELVAAAVDVLAGWTGHPPVQVAADHEVYLADPSVLTAIVTGGRT